MLAALVGLFLCLGGDRGGGDTDSFRLRFSADVEDEAMVLSYKEIIRTELEVEDNFQT